MQPIVANSANNFGNHSFMTRAANTEAAMTLGTSRAAGLIRQSAGAEAFSYVRTLQANWVVEGNFLASIPVLL